MDYNKTFIVPYAITGASAGLKNQFSVPKNYMIKKLWAVVDVEGAAGTHRVDIKNVANDATYATLTIGDAPVGSVLSASVDEDQRPRAGGEALRIYNVNNSTSSAYTLYVLFAHQE
jgi:hypothetical protein